jgi:hypothetical protein
MGDGLADMRRGRESPPGRPGDAISRSPAVRARSRQLVIDTERERAIVNREEHVFPHHTLERFSIDARHGWRLQILPR